MARYLTLIVLSLLLLGALPPLAAQEASKPAISEQLRGRLDDAKAMIMKAEYTAAIAALEGVLAGQPGLGEAEYLLGVAIVADDRSKDGREKAAEHFLAGARAGYCIPFGEWPGYKVSVVTYCDANWKPAKKLMDGKDPQDNPTIENLLKNIVVVSRKEHDASEHLGRLYISTGQNRKALDLFQTLLETSPDQSESIYNLGLSFFDIYNRQIAEAVLADLSSQGSERMTALMKLLMARAFFVLEEDRIANVYYFQCLDDLNDIVAREMYRDVLDIILPDEKTEFVQSRTIEQKKIFFRKFWKSRDPSPTTEFNERLVEHYRRMNYAKQHYALKQTKGYDDRGIIYIKHGEPDEHVTLMSNFGVRANESWLYRRKPQNFIYHFVEKTNAYYIVPNLAEAIIGSSLQTSLEQLDDPGQTESPTVVLFPELSRNFKELLMNRAEIDPLYFRMATILGDARDPTALTSELESQFAMDEARIMEPGLTTGMATETYVPEMGSEAMDYYYYTADFMAMNANSNVNIFYGMPVEQLEFKRDIIGVRVNYENTFAVFDQNWNEVKRVYNRRSYQLSQEPDRNNKGLLLVDKQNINLPPGQYHYSVSVRDLGSNHLGIYKGDLDVSHYQVNDFNVSQIVIASNVTPLGEQKPGKFTRGQFNVMPLPSRTFRRDQPVFVYYEVYFLTKDGENKKRYKVDFTIEADRLDRNLASKIFASFGKLVSKSEDKGKITLTFDKEGDAETIAQAEYISIDIKDSPAGHYNLKINVTDMVSGQTLTRNNEFSIVQPGK